MGVNSKIKFTGYVRTVLESVNIAKKFPKPLPLVKVHVPKKPYKLKHPVIKTGEGRFIVLKGILTDLFRDERVELPLHRAVAARPYAERLIQIAIEYGDRHVPTMETCDYWMLEKDLIQKLFKLYVPRFRDCKTNYTRIFHLPSEYKQIRPNLYKTIKRTVLELKGNPYPAVLSHPEDHRNSLLNILLDEARKRYNAEKAKEKSSIPTLETKKLEVRKQPADAEID